MNRGARQAALICFFVILSSGVLAGDVVIPLGEDGWDMEYDIARELLYVSVPTNDEIILISTRNYEIVDRVFIGPNPRGIDLSLDGTHLFVALYEAGSVAVLDLDALTVTEIVVGQVIGDSRTWDVVEGRPNRVFVSASPGSSGTSRIGMIKLDEGNEVVVVADNQIIRSSPVFEASPDHDVLYIGERERLFKLDIQQESAPIVLASPFNAVSSSSHLELEPNGSHLYMRSGEVVRTDDFEEVASNIGGVPAFGSDPSVYYVAHHPGRIAVYDTATVTQIDELTPPCAFSDADDLVVLPGDDSWLVLVDDQVCGIVTGLACSSAPPESSDPEPPDGQPAVSLDLTLDWSNGGSDCPSTYDVLLGTGNPPMDLICDDLLEARCETGELQPETTYFWQVIATNDQGTTAGPVWSFTTGPFIPPVFGNVVIPLGGVGFDMLYDDERGLLHVSIPSLNEVVLISTLTYEIIDRVPVGPSPHGIDLSLDGTRLFAALNEAGSVAIFDMETGQRSEIVVGEILGDYRTWDVTEATEDRLFVSASPGSNGSSRIGMIELDQGNEVVIVADNESIDTRPLFAVDGDQRFLYIGEGPSSAARLYKLDLEQETAPIILRDGPSDLTLADHLELDPDGTRLYLEGGHVVRTATFVQAGNVPRGIHQFGESAESVFIASPPDLLGTYDTTTFSKEDERTLPCAFDDIEQMVVLPDDAGWLVLGDEFVCGLLAGVTCQSIPPGSSTPAPADGAMGTQTDIVLTWNNAGAACPTTYEVYFGTENPPGTLICDDVAERRCDPGNLDPDTTYYWQVVASNNDGMTTGPTWSFTTGPSPHPPRTDLVVELGGLASDIAYDSARQLVYVSVPSRDEIVVVSTQTREVVDRLVPGPGPQGIDLSIDGSRLFVALSGTGTIAILDIDTGATTEVEVGSVIGDPQLYDVIEARQDRVFVSANGPGFSRIGMIKLDQGNQVVVVADNTTVSADPVFEVSPDRRFLYVGGSDLLKLDLNEEDAPIVLETSSAAFHMEVSPDGSRIYLGSGRIRDTENFLQRGRIAEGPHRFGAAGDEIFTAVVPGSIETFETTTFTRTNEMPLPCSFDEIDELVVLPGESGWLVIGDDLLCGVVTAPLCASVPDVPADPRPSDVGFGVVTRPLLRWRAIDSGCPSTYDVFLDRDYPPTTRVCSALTDATCAPTPLEPATVYYWQVIASNDDGSVAGPVWSFTTSRFETPVVAGISTALGGAGLDMAYDDQRDFIYVSIPTRNWVQVISPETFEILIRVPIPGNPHGIDVSMDGTRLFVALNANGHVVVLELDGGAMTSIDIGPTINDRLYDVVEGRENRLFVSASPFSAGSSPIHMVKLDENNQITTIGGSRTFRVRPTLRTSPERRFLYLGEDFRSLYKFKIDQEDGPIVVSRSFLERPADLAVNADGSRIYLGSGQVLRTGSFIEVGQISEGIPFFSEGDSTIYVARAPDLIDAYHAETLTLRETFVLPCTLSEIDRFIVLPGQDRFALLGDGVICGVTTDVDDDGVSGHADNCPFDPNPDQLDLDGDGAGDVCDNCLDIANPDQADVVHPNGIGDACDDPDADAVVDLLDNCADVPNVDQADSEGDGAGDACDVCPSVFNPEQQEAIACIDVTEDGGQCLETHIDLRAGLSGDTLIFEPGGVPPTSITLTMLATSCGPPDLLTLWLNQGFLGEVALDPSVSCACDPEIQSFVISDAELLAAHWISGDLNVIRVGVSGVATGVAWVRARVETAGDSVDICLIDVGGGDCDEPNLCLAGFDFSPFENDTVLSDPFQEFVLVSETPFVDSQLTGLIDIREVADGPIQVCVRETGVAAERSDCVTSMKQGEEDMAINDAPCGPPAADAGADTTVECTSPVGAAITLDGSGSTDPNSTPGTNDDIVQFEWYENFGSQSEIFLGAGETLEVILSTGIHSIALRVTDSFGVTDVDETVVAVTDTVAPTLSVELNPTVLWPPNHRMVDVVATVIAADLCSVPMIVLESIVADEPDDAAGGGDGNTVDDIQGAETGSPDFEFRLRAERAGSGDGRAYTVVYTASDFSGNTSSTSAAVVVPHDQGGGTEPVHVTASKTTEGILLEWIRVEGAVHYNVVRAVLSNVHDDGAAFDLGPVVCIEALSLDEDTQGWEDSALPSPGEVYVYLIEYDDGRKSSYGTETAAKPRIPGPGDCQ